MASLSHRTDDRPIDLAVLAAWSVVVALCIGVWALAVAKAAELVAGLA